MFTNLKKCSHISENDHEFGKENKEEKEKERKKEKEKEKKLKEKHEKRVWKGSGCRTFSKPELS